MIPYETFEAQVLAILDELHAFDREESRERAYNHRRAALALSVTLGRMAQTELDEITVPKPPLQETL